MAQAQAATLEATVKKLRPVVENCLRTHSQKREFQKKGVNVFDSFRTELLIEAEKDRTPEALSDLWHNFASNDSKRRLVRFMWDVALRNMNVWHQVADIQEMLSTAETWEIAFHDVKQQAPYSQQEVERLPFKNPQEEAWMDRPKRPIPYFIDMLALACIAMPITAGTQQCNCERRWGLVLEGIVYCLVWPVFEAFFALRHDGLMSWLARGEYGFAISYRDLPWWYWPSVGFQPDAAALPGYQEAMDAEEEKERQQAIRLKEDRYYQPPKPVEPTGNETQDFKWVEKQTRFRFWGIWGSQHDLVSKAEVLEGRFKDEFPLKVKCKDWKWDGEKAMPQDPSRNPGRGVYNGDCWSFERPGGTRRVWSKLGLWRLEVLRKFLILFIPIGIGQIYASVTYDIGTCGSSGTRPQVPVALRSVFLLDPAVDDWEAQKTAAMGIVDRLATYYPPVRASPGTFFVAVGSHGSSGKAELPFTDQPSQVKDKLGAMSRPCTNCSVSVKAGLNWADSLFKPLSKNWLSRDPDKVIDMTVSIVGNNAVPDVASDFSGEVRNAGIFVGTNDASKQLVKDLFCNNETSDGACRFWAMDDFEALNNNSSKIAEDVAMETTKELTQQLCYFPRETAWSLLFLVPWFLFRCCVPGPRKKATNDIELGGKAKPTNSGTAMIKVSS